MKCFLLFTNVLGLSLLTACVGSMNPTGGNRSPNYPYYITTEPTVVKKIRVPAQTKLTYEKHFLRRGEQKKQMREQKLARIELPAGETIIWGGVPVRSISKYFNSDMRGFSVTADFTKVNKVHKNEFSALWESCNTALSVNVNNIADWSFNIENISDIEGCGVLYQRYFKDDAAQQKVLDQLYQALRQVSEK